MAKNCLTSLANDVSSSGRRNISYWFVCLFFVFCLFFSVGKQRWDKRKCDECQQPFNSNSIGRDGSWTTFRVPSGFFAGGRTSIRQVDIILHIRHWWMSVSMRMVKLKSYTQSSLFRAMIVSKSDLSPEPWIVNTIKEQLHYHDLEST